MPDKGDLVWLDFNPQSGHEQSGKRPALILSPAGYNGKTRLALCVPITSRQKGYPFEVILPDDLPVNRVILSDHIKNLDWKERNATFIGVVPPEVLAETVGKFLTLVE